MIEYKIYNKPINSNFMPLYREFGNVSENNKAIREGFR